MTGIENAQHDLKDAASSLSTAIDLLDSIGTESSDEDIEALVRQLRTLKNGLDKSRQVLEHLHAKEQH